MSQSILTDGFRYQDLFNLTTSGNLAAFQLSTGANIGDVLTCIDQYGNGAWDTFSSLGVKSLTGTIDEVLVNGTYGVQTKGDITLTTPQPINTSSSPTFNQLTLTSLLLPSLTSNTLTFINGSNLLSSVSLSSPLSLSAGVLSLQYNTTNLKLTVSQLNTIQDISTSSSPTFNALTTSTTLNVGTDCIITGNLTVNGTTTTVNSQTLSVTDPLIQVANNNSSSDLVDIGIFGEYYDGSTLRYTGFFRKASTGQYQLFKNLTVLPTTTVNTSSPSYALADLLLSHLYTVNITNGVTSSIISSDGTGLLTALVVGSGLIFTSNTLSPNLNSTNLQITASQINTTQDISTLSSPTFAALTLSSPLTGSSGGTGHNNGSLTINLSSGATGKVLTSDSSGNATYSALSSLGVTSLTGTANQVLVNSTSGTPTTGVITLTTPQDINTSSSPTFASLTLSSQTSAICWANASHVLGNVNTSSNLSFNTTTGFLDTIQAIQTSSSPTFAGLTLSSQGLFTDGNSTFTIPGTQPSIILGTSGSKSGCIKLFGTVNPSYIHATDSNLHLDATSGVYLNWYSGGGGVFFGNGAQGRVGSVSAAGIGYLVGLGISDGSPATTLSVSGNCQIGNTSTTAPANGLVVYGKVALAAASGFTDTDTLQHIQMGDIATAVGVSQGMSGGFFRIRELSAVDQITLSTNYNATAIAQDNGAYPSWYMFMGNDSFGISRSPPGSVSLASLLNLSNTGEFNIFGKASFFSSGFTDTDTLQHFQIGQNGTSVGYSQGLGGGFFRMREIAAVNQITLSTNYNASASSQDNGGYPSWYMFMGNDSFGIQRSPAGSVTFVNLLGINNTGNGNIVHNWLVGTSAAAGEQSCSVKNTDNTGLASYRLINDGTPNGIIFLNGSMRVSDGGNNCMTVRNDAGDLRLQSLGGLGLFVQSTTGYVGISNNSPPASLTINASLTGSAVGTTFMSNAGTLTSSLADEISLANIGFVNPSGNNSSLGIRAYRNTAGSSYTTNSIVLGVDVDSTVRSSGYLTIATNGFLGVNTFLPAYTLDVNGTTNTLQLRTQGITQISEAVTSAANLSATEDSIINTLPGSSSYTQVAGTYTDQKKLIRLLNKRCNATRVFMIDGGTILLSPQNSSVQIRYTADGWYVDNSLFIDSFFPTTQKSRVVPGDNTGNPTFGTCVSMSANGLALAIGGPNDNSNQGASWIYNRTVLTSTWTENGKYVGITGSATGRQGTSIAMSNDGVYFVCGSPYGNTAAGEVYVFWIHSGTTYSQQAKITNAFSDLTNTFGTTVAIDSTNSVILIGSPIDNGGIGGCYLYNRSSSTWSQIGGAGAGFTPANGVGTAYGFGNSVVFGSWDPESTTTDAILPMVIGGPSDNTNIGAVWIYTLTGTATVINQQKLTVGSSSKLGYVVAISADNQTIVAGSSGKVYVFKSSTGNFSGYSLYQTISPPSSNTGTKFGLSLCMSADGNNFVVGDYDQASVGTAWSYTLINGIYTYVSNLSPSGSSGSPEFAFSLCCDAVAKNVVAGCVGDSTNGSFYSFW